MFVTEAGVNSMYYVYTDHLGSINTITNDAGLPVYEQTFDAWGRKRNVNDWTYDNVTPPPNWLWRGFTSHEHLPDYDLIDMNGRMYDPIVSQFVSVDPMLNSYPGQSPYNYALNNPLKYIDPSGLGVESTDVKKIKDGVYEVVGAQNDEDNNIYVVDDKGKRTKEIIGRTLNPWDFMKTDDATGKFVFDKKVITKYIDLNNLTVSGNIKGDNGSNFAIKNFSGEDLTNFATKLFTGTRTKSGTNIDLAQLALLSANKGILDLKYHLGAYTPIGLTNGSIPLITTVRAVGNIAFGANMRTIQENSNMDLITFYGYSMTVVGKYNQYKNTGNGYNSGYPFYGEHTYSGSNIYFGYFKKLYKK